MTPAAPASTAPVLVGRASSINVRKVLWTAAELGLPLERREAGDDLAALNPNRLVPVLLDGDFVLWESNSVCRYLARREGRTDLLPTAARAQAEVERWMDWQATELNSAWRDAFMGLVRQHPAFQDAARIAASTAAWNRQMALLDQHLARGGPFVAGADFTLADVVLGLSTNRWLLTPIERPPLPAVDAWHSRLLQRAGYRVHGANGTP